LSVDIVKIEKLGYCDLTTFRDFVANMPEPEDAWGFGADYLADKMLNKMIVPIRDDSGEIVAVATRSIVAKEKGWWNTPFRKEAYIYGMDSARNEVFHRNKVYLFEGYVDRMYLFQAGLKNSVSIMGITLTHMQAGVILRYCNRLCVCFDTDPMKNGKEGGGQSGLKRLVETFNVSGEFDKLSAIVLPLKGDGTAYDPDEFVMDHSLQEFLSMERNIKKESDSGVGSFLFS
jgi:DNA primase